MLVGTIDGVRIIAAIAERGPEYRCPSCNGMLVLRKGRKVVHHFAHKPPTSCSWAKGETQAHLEAKQHVAGALSQRGIRAELEYTVDTLPGDRRADVMAWSPSGRMIAFELQHTPLGRDEIERRAYSYSRADIAQVWIPFIRGSVWKDGVPTAGGWRVERYSPRDFERWVHGFNMKNGMWMYDTRDKSFWLGRLSGHQVYVPETTWYSENGEENYGGGFSKYSKRHKELSLSGPYDASELKIKIIARKAYSKNGYNWPPAFWHTLSRIPQVIR